MSNSRSSYILMLSSASFNGLLGIVFSFMPQEVLAQFGIQEHPLVVLILQVTGALFMGFAMMNYTAKKAVIGGIYNRALQMGNTVYNTIAAITLTKFLLASVYTSPALIAVSLTYLMLAISFLRLLFTSPVKESNA